MKKLLIMLLGVLIALPAVAADGDDFQYSHEGQTLTYTVISEANKTAKTKEGIWLPPSAGNNISGDLILPEKVTYNGEQYTLTTIGEYGFIECSGLTSITIPNSVTSIGNSAFDGCSGLTKVEISDLAAWYGIQFASYKSNPLSYAHHLYLNGSEITEIVIPNEVTSIGNYVFAGWSGLKKLEIHKSVTSIGNSAFDGCSGLTSIDIPGSVTTIGDRAFQSCSGLTSVTIGNGATSIGNEAFSLCSGLTSIDIPGSVTTIGMYAFGNCSSLTSLDIPEGVTTLGYMAIGYCENLTTVSLPSSLRKIGSSLFEGCDRLKNVNMTNGIAIPDGVTEISDVSGYGYIYTCLAETLIIPNSVTSQINIGIGDALKNIYIGDGVTSVSTDSRVSGIEILKLGNKVETFYRYNEAWSSLKELALGASFKDLSELNLSDSNNLMLVTSLNTSIPAGFDSFSEATKANGFLYVPAAAYQTYKEGTDFAHIIPVDDTEWSLTADDFSLIPNQEITFPVSLSRIVDSEYAGLQFDLQLPEGIALQSINLNEELASLYTASSKLQDNNTYRYIAYAKGQAYTTLSRDVVNITVKANPGIEANDMKILITNALATRIDASEIQLDDLSINVKVNNPVTSASITPETRYMYQGDTLEFTVAYEPADAEDHDFTWSISGNKLVKVSSDANSITVRASDFGSDEITATYTSNPEIQAKARIEVIDHLVIGGEKTTIKETEKMQLSYNWETAPVSKLSLPDDIQWTSENPQYATVEASTGLLTGVAAGEAVIKGVSASKPYINASFTVTVEPRIIGDANDSKYVNVADVVAIANDIAGYPVYNFCFVNADTDSNGTVNIADLTKTVDIILNDNNYRPYALRKISADASAPTDYLFVNNGYSSQTFDVKMHNTRDYVALQATMAIPENIKVTEVSLGQRALAHSVISNVNDNTVKIVIFSLDNAAFIDGDMPLFSVRFTGDGNLNDIDLAEIITSDAMSNEYELGYMGYDVSGIGYNALDGINITAIHSGVRVDNADGLNIVVVNSIGQTVKVVANAGNCETIHLESGFYIVAAGNTVSRIMVK
ncbi:MAG: leucine-rich repeat protein [Muribaculaceae bacterium]|nr:leucine-rich repeat protein [Muribaculaceae bacterium]